MHKHTKGNKKERIIHSIWAHEAIQMMKENKEKSKIYKVWV